jgi:Spx/MgsR family transcriptional regulator
MTDILLHGIPNCDTVKRARAWLDAQGLAYRFRDFKKAPPAADEIGRWIGSAGHEALVNRRGTTFRKLDPADKAGEGEDWAAALMQAHPSLIRRPLVEHDGGLLVGFDPAAWAIALGR